MRSIKQRIETAKSADDGGDVPPGNLPSEPKFTSLTDPAAAWTNKGQMKALFAYETNYLRYQGSRHC